MISESAGMIRARVFVFLLLAIVMLPMFVYAGGGGSANTGPVPGKTGAVGGSGGSPFEVRCPAGSVMTGLSGRAGRYVDRVQPVCSFGFAGASGGGGGSPYSLSCPPGEVVVGIYGGAAVYADRTGLTCSSGAKAATVGGGGGSAYDLKCPTGEDVVGLYGRSARWLDQIGALCEAKAAHTPVPSCSISISPNPIYQGQSAILSWSSSDADSFYIQNIGYVGVNGSTTITPSQTTSYAGTVTNTSGSASCSGVSTLTVQRNCTLPWGGTITHGQSVTAWQASSVPWYSSCTSQSRTCTNGTLSGTYQYQSCTVQDRPTCTPTYFCSGNTYSYRNNYCEESTVKACTKTCTPTGCSEDMDPPTGSLSGVVNGQLTGTILVREGDTAQIQWSSSGASSCSVTGTNGDSWSGTSGTRTTSPITGTTVYTLNCTNDGGSMTPKTVTVKVVPRYQEI